MKKRFLCTMLAGMMALSLAGCGGKDDTNNNPTPTPVVEDNGGENNGGENNTNTDNGSDNQGEKEPEKVDFSVNELWESIESKATLAAAMPGTETELTELYKIDPSLVEEYVIRVPMMITQAQEFAMFKAKDEESLQKVLEGVNTRLESLLETWESYLPAQLELVQNHKLLVKDNYVFFIICESDVAAYAENVFLRQFDPSLEEVVLLRKFNHIVAKITSISEDAITLEYEDAGETFVFEGTYDEFLYVEGEFSELAVGDSVDVAFAEDVVEGEQPMKAVVTYISEISDM